MSLAAGACRNLRAEVGGIIVAAGSGQRMRGMDKLFASLLGVPLLARTVELFETCPLVDTIVVVLAQDRLKRGQALAKERGWKKVAALCPGGPRRQDSVRLGLKALPPCAWVVVHDGARPCLEIALIVRGLDVARETGAAAAAMPVKDTVKVADPTQLVKRTLDRGSLWAVQTPQVFRRDVLVRAHEEVREDVTDDASMAERLGIPVKLFMGSYANIKVTTPEDLAVAEALLRQKGL